MPNKLCQALNTCKFLVTAECLPPVGADAEALLASAAKLPDSLDAIVLPDNPDRIRLSAFSAATLLGKARKSKSPAVIMAMTARDRNRCGLTSDALGAAAVGISGILCVSGNHQSLGICPQAASANGVDSVQLVQMLKNVVLHGSDTDTGKSVSIQVGALVQPYMEPPELSLVRLKKKVAVGADFLMTQAIFDLAGFEKWMASVRELGLDKRTVILPSVLILDSEEKARRLQTLRTYGTIDEAVVRRVAKAADPAREGVALAAEIAQKLKKIPGVRGIHLLCGGCESLAGEVIKQAGL